MNDQAQKLREMLVGDDIELDNRIFSIIDTRQHGSSKSAYSIGLGLNQIYKDIIIIDLSPEDKYINDYSIDGIQTMGRDDAINRFKELDRDKISEELSNYEIVIIYYEYESEEDLIKIFDKSNEMIIVVGSNGDDILSGYSLIKTISENIDIDNINILMSNVRDKYHSKSNFEKLEQVTNRYLKRELNNIGYIGIKDSNILIDKNTHIFGMDS